MFARILVPTDGSELSEKAARGAIEFGQRLGAGIVGLTVVEPYSYTTLSEYRPEPAADYEQRIDAMARERLRPLETAAKAANVEIETVVVRSFSPYEAIIDTAGRRHCDVIFMASHGRRGLSAILLGSETQKVLTHTEIPVMVYR
jgi:nucleotide-binding universal stress UspA family protein